MGCRATTLCLRDQYADLTVDELGGLLGSFQNSPPASSPVGLLVVRDPDPFTGANFQQIEGARLPRLGARTAEYGPVLPASKATPAEETGIACDRSHGFFRGRLYQIFMDTVPGVFSQQSGGYRGEETVDCDIFCRYSDNKGDSWSDLVRVNDDSGGFSQFLPRIAVDQTSGHVAISYCDASLDPNNTKIVLRLALSRDGGKTFCRSVRVSVGLTNAQITGDNGCGSYAANVLGDYLGLDFFSGRLFPVWADNSHSSVSPSYTELLIARLRVNY